MGELPCLQFTVHGVTHVATRIKPCPHHSTGRGQLEAHAWSSPEAAHTPLPSAHFTCIPECVCGFLQEALITTQSQAGAACSSFRETSVGVILHVRSPFSSLCFSNETFTKERGQKTPNNNKKTYIHKKKGDITETGEAVLFRRGILEL